MLFLFRVLLAIDIAYLMQPPKFLFLFQIGVLSLSLINVESFELSKTVIGANTSTNSKMKDMASL